MTILDEEQGREVLEPRSSLWGAPMETSERTRLENLLGMLGSSFAGERANAARMIAAMAEAKKITINELIALAHPSGQQRTKPPSPQDDFTDVDKCSPSALMRQSEGLHERRISGSS